jgi:hypothetical protein
MSVVSSIKPEKAEDLKPQIDVNDETYESYIKEGFEENIPHSVQAPHDRLMKFLAQAGDRPIKRMITYIERLKPASMGYKEFLIYRETLIGTTWAGDECKYIDHLVGYHKKQIKSPKINEKKEVVEYVRSGQRDVYTIPYTKQKLDEIISKSDETGKDSITLYIRNPHGAQKASFYYEEFVLDWHECINILLLKGGPEAQHIEQIIKRK